MVYIADTAKVDGVSQVEDGAKILDYAAVEISNIFGCAIVSDHAELLDCDVGDTARVYDNASLSFVNVWGGSCVFGNANLSTGHVDFMVELRGDCKFGGNATFKGLESFEDFVKKYGAAKAVFDYDYNVIVLTDVWDMG